MKIKIRFKYPDNPIRYIKGSDLVPHPQNWRTHPTAQLDALRGVFAEVGMVDAVKGIELEDGRVMLIDGHARAEILPDQEIPVLILDLTPEEAKKILATFDTVGDLAGVDTELLDSLLAQVNSENIAISQMLAQLAEENGIGVQEGVQSLKDVEIKEPPKMTWVLIGIPVVKYGEIAAIIENIANDPGTIVETTVTNAKAD